MEELLADLPLVRPVRDALLFGAGEIGQILATIYAFENSDAGTLQRLNRGDATTLLDDFAEEAVSGESTRSRLLTQ